MRLRRTAVTVVLGIPISGVLGAAPQDLAPAYAVPEAMPVDRVEDSYAVYSALLPGSVIEWGNVPRSIWLVRDTTEAEPLGASCVGGGEDGLLTNPHQSILAPKERQAALAELLADFDARCHQRFQLGQQFHLKLPVRLLDKAAQDQYAGGVSGYMPPADDIMRAPATPDAFRGAAGLHSFTAVYFNSAHTLAMTHIGMYCGSLCGNWSWAVLERTPQGWRVLPWGYASVIS